MISSKYNLFFLVISLILILESQTFAENIEKNGASIFMYHRFDETKYPSTNTNINQLEKHLSYVTSNNFNIETIDEILKKKKENKSYLPKTISFTVDDAFLSFYEKGWPLFKKYNIPVTLFISTDIVNQSHWNYMHWDDIRKFIEEGGSVGLHSASHMHLPLNKINHIKNDLIWSAKVFEKELGFIPKVFAYPYGEASKEIINILKEQGIEYAFGQHSGLVHSESDSFYLPRFALNENYGKIDRFIFSANLKPLIIKDFLPDKKFLTLNKKPIIKFNLVSEIKKEQLNCFSNSGGDWNNLHIEVSLSNQVTLKLEKPFLSGRGRINCTAKINNDWLWFGYQFLIK